MRNGAEDMEDQFAGGGRGVDFFLKAEQGEATRLQLLDDRDQFGEGAAEPVEAYDSRLCCKNSDSRDWCIGD